MRQPISTRNANNRTDQYFLREIRLPGKVGFKFPRTAGENAAAERVAGGAKPDVVASARVSERLSRLV